MLDANGRTHATSLLECDYGRVIDRLMVVANPNRGGHLTKCSLQFVVEPPLQLKLIDLNVW